MHFCVFLFIIMHNIMVLCIFQQKNAFILAFGMQLRYDRWRTAGQGTPGSGNAPVYLRTYAGMHGW